MNPKYEIHAPSDDARELLGSVNEKLTQCMTEKTFPSFLRFYASFSNHPVENTILAFSQMPQATKIATLEWWQQHQRIVRPDAKPLDVFLPHYFYKRMHVDGKAMEVRRVGLTVYQVYDVSQTQQIQHQQEQWKSKERPAIAESDVLAALRAVSPVKIEFEKALEQQAVYSSERNCISLRADTPPLTASYLSLQGLSYAMTQSISEAPKDVHSRTLIGMCAAVMTLNAMGFEMSQIKFSDIGLWAKHQTMEKQLHLLETSNEISGILKRRVMNELERNPPVQAKESSVRQQLNAGKEKMNLPEMQSKQKNKEKDRSNEL